MFNIITRRTLNEYRTQYPEAAQALQKWYVDMKAARFGSMNELKAVYGNASVIADNRVVFNIHGNKYRLIVRINFQFKGVQIKWFGPHAEYDMIDAATISYKDQ
ncbi:type II toxin-antitoxin system HigB family toxin [Spirosoma montaniterrae]|uniref:Addiction module toxin RelE n=1 Tax=Spirosoma montaniterrae TaxID=1178516 RepID=A0A1P9X2A6_9BACT|nr:type II toxin-antitoxin system HigB family toxin [Spirosoma montaniterrae]AQG81770.1 addiction module toxin RelE [Spirosoma montaniterrae]